MHTTVLQNTYGETEFRHKLDITAKMFKSLRSIPLPLLELFEDLACCTQKTMTQTCSLFFLFLWNDSSIPYIFSNPYILSCLFCISVKETHFIHCIGTTLRRQPHFAPSTSNLLCTSPLFLTSISTKI